MFAKYKKPSAPAVTARVAPSVEKVTALPEATTKVVRKAPPVEPRK